MQRILIRFLLEKERQSDEVGEGDFSELKQDLQMIRFEMLNEMKKTRDDSIRMINHLNTVLIILGDEIFKNSKSDINLNKYLNHKKYEINNLGHKIDVTKNDENKLNKIIDSVDTLGSSIEINSSSSSENGTESINSASSDSINSISTNLSDISIFSISSLNENNNKKFENKIVLNYELDIIKEEEDDDITIQKY
jgi:hypothetical protein